ncbi:LOW QUALITY PROTEIN: zinc finger CCCH domain-containing protein 19-like [Neltuma alba]|uniref:LOW QUALITY PROTEIN: zinc finger CCCH domain-containing protein 19-like n=1 Tax=Neltuma alba TaxID=207710 RepID=UPI0010A337EE|nr:LOW QUALITY PROTEIN: zinc finger CCCH domain-containing protein 19-like [Prosopis alba]
MDKPLHLLPASPMDKPSLPDAQRPAFDRSDPTLDLMTVDPCRSAGDAQDSRLLPVPVALDRDADVAVTQHGCLPDMKLKVDVKVADGSSAKRKRGRPARGTAREPPLKKNRDEEDVCFICFDGGSLVLCDRRGCPKAYHPACIKRDEAFFRSKAKWNCGWHICSICRKASHYMCYTCTYSLCKGCIKGTDFLCVRGNKGLCGICMRTIMLIENSAQGKKETCEVDFDDKSSWEYLFKVYWLYLKEKLSLTLDEILRAKNPSKGAAANGSKLEMPHEIHMHKDDKGSGSENSCIDIESNNLENNHCNRQPRLVNKEDCPNMNTSARDKEASMAESTKWASRELLEFVAHMKNGDTSVQSQHDVEALLLEYIRKNNLCDPQQKSQVVCDSRLVNLFRRERVGHFEMLKLLESHFLIKDDASANIIRSGPIDDVASQMEVNDNGNDQPIVANDKRQKTRKRAEVLLDNPDAYAAINAHNVNLIYVRRNQMENLIDDSENFRDMVVGSIVRIRVSSSDQKQEMYRLVHVIGTTSIAESYNIGSRTTGIVLEISNLNKKEVIKISEISDQDFSEDECKRLRQSIKYGFSKRLTLGELLDKALTLQAMRVNDLLEGEILQLNDLRDRASEKGHRKELRECVEKLQLLNSSEERQRRLQEIPKVYSDPNMDSMFDSDDDAEKSDERKQDDNIQSKNSGFNRREREPSSPRSEGGGCRALDFLVTAHEQIGNTCTVKNQTSPSDTANGDSNNLVVATSGSSAVASDPPSLPFSTGNEQPFNDLATDKVWHYRDPSGKIQGPFSLLSLYKWNESGHFPSDLRIWKNTEEQDDSILLTDVLSGKCYKNASLPCSSQLLSLGIKAVQGNEDDIDLPSCTPVTSSSTCVDSTSTVVPATKITKNSQIGFLELPGDNSKPTHSEHTDQSAENKRSWSTASSLAGGGTPLPEVTVEWRRCSPAPPNPSIEEWDSNLVSASSLKPAETAGDCTATPSSICGQLTHSSPSNPACNTSAWQAMMDEPNDFGSFGETVSDLLAEMEAMGSLGGLESPTSIMKCGEELTEGSNGLSPAEGLSPMPDAGKGDALSSTGDLQFNSQSTAPEVPLCQPEGHYHQRISGGHSSRSSEVGGTKNHVSGSQWRSGSGIPSTAAWAMPTDATWRIGQDSRSGWEASHLNTNLGWGVMDNRGNANTGWGVGQGPVQENRNLNSYTSVGTAGAWGNQSRHGNDRFSPRGRDMSRGRHVWNRQPFGGGNGGSQRPPPRGQRICKFYESGYCKKGASCDYLHP